MVFQRIFPLSIVLYVLLTATPDVNAAPLLDPIDECILICDKCFKSELLLDCANECLFKAGEMSHLWRNQCPHFDAYLPSVQMMGFKKK